MSDFNQNRPARTKMLTEIFNFVGGISGLLSIGLLIFRGGALLQVVSEHDRRIIQMENGGSSLAREHIKLDDERVATLKDRTSKLEAVMALIPNIERDVAVMRVQIDALLKALERDRNGSKL